MHRKKNRVTKYGGVFLLAQNSFNIFIVSQSEVIYTVTQSLGL